MAKKIDKNDQKSGKKSSKDEKPLIIPNTKFILTIKAKDALKAYDKALNKLAKQVKTSGFRQGKVPPAVAEKQLDTRDIVEEALGEVIPEVYATEIKKNKYEPLTYPEFNPVSLEKGKDWKIEAFIAEKPQIDLKNYQKVVKDAVKAAKKAHKEHDDAAKKAGKDKNQPKPTPEQENEHMLQHIYSELVMQIKPQIQELLVKREAQADLRSIADRIKQMNMTLDEFLEKRQTSFEEFSQGLAAEALSRLQLNFILTEIAEKADLQVDKKEIDVMISKTQDKSPEYRAFLERVALRDKVAQHLLSQAK